jgi:GT2 family glycosyltransferase
MDVSILIVNYNTISFLIDAIDSIFEKTEGIKFEIIVIDNNSKDNSEKILAEKYGDKIIYLGLHENIGFGRANNEGSKIAKGRNLFFLNPDTKLINNAVKKLSDYMDNNPDVGCCGGNLLNENEKPTISFRRIFPSLFEEINIRLLSIPEKVLFGKNLIYNYSIKPIKVSFILGADLMIRKELFNAISGFDSDFFLFYEEIELQYRIKKLNYLIINVPYAKIVHLEGKSSSNNFDRLIKQLNSKTIFLKKTNNSITLSIISILSFARIKSRLFIFTLLRNKEKITFWSNINKVRKQEKLLY